MESLFDMDSPEVVRESAVEYGIRVKAKNESFKGTTIRSSQDVAEFCRPFYADDIEIREMFCAVFLNRAGNTIGWATISQGGRTATVVDSGLLAKLALDTLASGVVLVHNHPSGTLSPSVQDDNLTKKLKGGLALLDITVLDHVILSPSGRYYSYSDEGRL